MINTTGWVAELTERRERAESKKKAAQIDIDAADQEIRAIDAALTGLQTLASIDGGGLPPILVDVSDGGGPLPLWRRAHVVFTAADKPMRIPDVIKQMGRPGGPTFKGANARETVRTIIRAKPTVFEALGDGY
jgi:hypothetical protein